ncbi:hypothetical protein [Spirillospora sp. CA-294931]|uniref:hypothetical protein n=1 Tax=Spirillospora sp. CA-294931 TaxID=3240042 RepID=UPI003D8E6C9A
MSTRTVKSPATVIDPVEACQAPRPFAAVVPVAAPPDLPCPGTSRAHSRTIPPTAGLTVTT